MKYRSLSCGLFILSLAAFAPAQEVKTIFARKLHVTIPGDVSAGGVAWSESSIGLPRAWSGEGGGTRTEVAEESSVLGAEAQKERLLKILPGAQLTPIWVSGTPSWEGTSGDASIVGVPMRSGFWIVLAKGPAAKSVTDSICAERDGPAGFMPRTIPGGMNMVLPYNFAPRRGRAGWELKFQGFEADLRVDKAGEGMRFDTKKSMDDEIANFKENEAYSDVKVERKKAGGAGEIAIINYKEGGRARERLAVIATANGNGIQLNWTFDPGQREHREYSNRMANTFKETKDMVVDGEQFICDDSGFSFETRAALTRVEKGDVTEWTGDAGGLVVTARHVKGSTSTDPSGAAALFPDLVKAQMGDTPGFKSETVPYMVSGVDGLLVKTEWKGVTRQGLFVATYNGIYVLDVMSMNKVEVEHTIRSAQLTISKMVEGLQEYSFKDSALKTILAANAERVASEDEKPYKFFEMYQSAFPGECVLSSHMYTLDDDKADVGDLPKLTKDYAEEMGKALKGKTKIISQGWQSESLGASYWMVFEITANGVTFKGYTTFVANGAQLLMQGALLIKDDPNIRALMHLVMNSYRLSTP